MWVGCTRQTGQQLSSAVGTSAVDQLSCQKQTLLGLEGFLEPENMGLIQKSKKFVETLLLWVLNPSQRGWGLANLSFKTFYSVGFFFLKKNYFETNVWLWNKDMKSPQIYLNVGGNVSNACLMTGCILLKGSCSRLLLVHRQSAGGWLVILAAYCSTWVSYYM